jgi:hypothetical protein
METSKKQIPIEKILFEIDYHRRHARSICSECGIETAQQLATYNRFAFKVEGRRRGIYKGFSGRTIDYLEECLKRAGMSFAPEPPQAKGYWAPYKIYGAKNTKEDILTTMKKIKTPESLPNIAAKAAFVLRERLMPYEYSSAPEFFQGKRWFNAERFANSVFQQSIVSKYLKELVKEGKVVEWKVSKRTLYERRDIPILPIIENITAQAAYRKLSPSNQQAQDK